MKVLRFAGLLVLPFVLAVPLAIAWHALLDDGDFPGISIWQDPRDPNVSYGVFVDENGCYSHIDVFSGDPDNPTEDALPGGCVSRPRGADVASWLTAGLLIVTIGGLMARRSGYRWFHAFALPVPVLGIIWYIKWAWRTASLPNRYWETTQPQAFLATN